MRKIFAILAACLAPLAVACAAGLTYWTITMLGIHSKGYAPSISELLGSLAAFMMVPAALVLVILLPTMLAAFLLYALLRAWHMSSLLAYVAAGVLLSFGVIFWEFATGVVSGIGFRYAIDWQYVITLIASLVAGPLATAVFWWIARPDREIS
jgi:hypothetical protein